MGPFAFLDPDHVLTAPIGNGPVDLWDLSGKSVLATTPPAEFDTGVAPVGSHLVGVSTQHGTDTLLGSRFPSAQRAHSRPVDLRGCPGRSIGRHRPLHGRSRNLRRIATAPAPAPGTEQGRWDRLWTAQPTSVRMVTQWAGDRHHHRRRFPACSVALFDVATKKPASVQSVSGAILSPQHLLHRRLQDTLGRRAELQWLTVASTDSPT